MVGGCAYQAIWLFSTETEFVVVVGGCVCQAIWLMKVLKEINHDQVNGTVVKCDIFQVLSCPRN